MLIWCPLVAPIINVLWVKKKAGDRCIGKEINGTQVLYSRIDKILNPLLTFFCINDSF